VWQQQRQEIMVSDVKHKKGAGGKTKKGKEQKKITRKEEKGC